MLPSPRAPTSCRLPCPPNDRVRRKDAKTQSILLEENSSSRLCVSATRLDMKIKAAIIGSGNIGTDLMIKLLRTARHLELTALVGIDPASDGLVAARRHGIATTAEGIDGLVRMPEFNDIAIVFDATSAGAHLKHDQVLRAHGKQVIDLTPAALGP